MGWHAAELRGIAAFTQQLNLRAELQQQAADLRQRQADKAVEQVMVLEERPAPVLNYHPKIKIGNLLILLTRTSQGELAAEHAG